MTQKEFEAQKLTYDKNNMNHYAVHDIVCDCDSCGSGVTTPLDQANADEIIACIEGDIDGVVAQYRSLGKFLLTIENFLDNDVFPRVEEYVQRNYPSHYEHYGMYKLFSSM